MEVWHSLLRQKMRDCGECVNKKSPRRAISDCRLIIIYSQNSPPPTPPSLGGGFVRGNVKFWLKSGGCGASLLEGGGPRSGGRRAMKSTIFIDLSTVCYNFFYITKHFSHEPNIKGGKKSKEQLKC